MGQGGPQPEPNGTRRLDAASLANVTPFIDGEGQAASSPDDIAVVNPANGRRLTGIPLGSVEDADRAVAAARRAGGAWGAAAPAFRKRTLLDWADRVEADGDLLDALDALEMGKPISTLAFNAAAAASFIRFNAEAIDKLNGDVFPSDRGSTVFQKRVPRGVVAAIVPWNFPTYNVCLKVAPAMAAGNGVVLKPSELASQSALRLCRLAVEAGIPPGLLNMVPGRGDIVGRALCEHAGVQMVAFTGSSAVGRRILQAAGGSNMKTVNAECGGKSAHIVFADCHDLDVAAASIAELITLNQGQVCSVGSRVLVERSIQARLVDRIVDCLARIRVGDPQCPDTSYGPIASRGQLDRVTSFIETAARDGATLACGGGRLLPDSGGFFIQPTVFVDVPPSARLAREEVFGPVLAVIPFDDAHEAVTLANATDYGLAAYVWTSSVQTAFRMTNALQTGVTVVYAAAGGEGAGDAFTAEPFGLSGVGSEGGLAGLQGYTRRQTMWFSFAP